MTWIPKYLTRPEPQYHTIIGLEQEKKPPITEQDREKIISLLSQGKTLEIEYFIKYRCFWS